VTLVSASLDGTATHPGWSENGATQPAVSGWMTAAELASRTPERVDWVIEGLAARGAITEVVAVIKGGKTTFIGNGVHALLTGLPFLGAATYSAEVWWITEERPATFRRLLERVGLLGDERLHILLMHEARGLAWPDMVASAVALAKPGDVLVVDTIGRLAKLPGDSENDAGAAQAAMAPLEAAAALGLAVIVGRHARKAGGDPESAGRGSSAWSGVSDIVLQLTKPGASHPPRNALTLYRNDSEPSVAALRRRKYPASSSLSCVFGGISIG
jgi:AAA domain